MENIKISIIIPVYNVEKYIDKCIQSILCQTFKEFEMILIDDGSPDKCGEICDEYAKKDNRIKVYHQENGGVSAARNLGIRESVGEYICFVDPDDYLMEDYCEKFYNAVKQTGTKLAICNYINFKNGDTEPTIESRKRVNSKTYVKHDAMEEYLLDDNNYEKYVVPITKIYHRSIWENLTFPEGKVYEDSYVYFQILYEIKDIAFIDDYLYARRLHDESIIHQSYSANYWYMVECKMEQVKYFYMHNEQRLVEISYDKMMYFFWLVMDGMHRKGIVDREMIDEYQKRLRETVKCLKITKTYPIRKVLSHYYIAYLKPIK